MATLVSRLRAAAKDGRSWGDPEAAADEIERLRALLSAADKEIEELRAVLQGIIDLGSTMGSALYAETVDRAARRALADAR